LWGIRHEDHYQEEPVMNQTWLLTITGAGALILMAMALMLSQKLIWRQRFAVRVQMTRGEAPVPVTTRQAMMKHIWSRVLAAMGQTILRTGLLSARTRAELELTLASSGLHGRNGLEVFIGSKLGLLVGLPTLAILGLRGVHIPFALTLLIPAAAALAGLLLPDMIVRTRRKKYLQNVEHGLPDALDLLVICSQAGLGLTAAVTRVAEEMREGRQPIGVELALTANELQLMDSRVALMNLGTRTSIDGLVRLSNTLLQSLQYGTPLTNAMRILSGEMRQDTLTRFEARAARLGVLLTLPMIVFILPCVFLVVGGPAAIQVMHVGG
jgi:tight adherence protein C